MCGRASETVDLDNHAVETDVTTNVRTNSDDITAETGPPNEQDQDQGVSLSVSNVIDFSNHDNTHHGSGPDADAQGDDSADPSEAMKTSISRGFDSGDSGLPSEFGVPDLSPQLNHLQTPNFASYEEYARFRNEIEGDYSSMILNGLGFVSVLIIGAVAVGWCVKRLLMRQARLYRPPAFSR
jgi:hypothetical protein